MKTFRATWILGGIFLLIAVYVYFVEIEGYKKKQAVREQKEKVLVFEKEKVESVILSNAHGLFEAKRSGEDGWTLVKPFAAPADKQVWNSILDAVFDLKSTRVISENGGDVAPYGLQAPQTRAEIQLKGSPDRLILRVGDENPVGDSLFVTDGAAQKVVLVPKSISYQLNKTLKQLREKRLFSVNTAETQEIQIQKQKRAIVLKKTDEKWFLASEKTKQEAQPEKVKEILDAIHFLEVSEFEDEDPKDISKFGLKNPQLVVSFRDAKATQTEVLFGNKEKTMVYVAKKAQKPVYKVNAYVLNRIPTDPEKIIKKEEKKTKSSK